MRSGRAGNELQLIYVVVLFKICEWNMKGEMKGLLRSIPITVADATRSPFCPLASSDFCILSIRKSIDVQSMVYL